MVKNIALFIDGTWNDANKNGETNVHKLYQAARVHQGLYDLDDGIPVARVGSSQVVYYLAGVGTGGDDKWRGGGAGFGTAERIREAYRFLALNYDPKAGDRVYLFGFSRGAFAARALAGFVGLVGLLLKNEATEKNVWLAYQLYKRAGKEGWNSAALQQQIEDFLPNKIGKVSPPGMKGETQKVAPPIYVHFIGLWDTVKKLGLPWQPTSWTAHYDNPLLPKHISHARHALALHDLRPEFEPTLWEGLEEPLTFPNRSLLQVWFPGAHADVGGGYAITNLSDVALAWMARESAAHYLCLTVPTATAMSPGVVHCEILFHPPAPREILSTWAAGASGMIKSFSMHDVAYKQLLNARPRTYTCEISKSKGWIQKLARWRKGWICINNGGAPLEKADQLALDMHLRLSFEAHSMSAPCSGAPGSSTEWWENVNLGDVADCTKVVEDFIDETEIIDMAQVLKALPLFVLCGGDLARLANRIAERTDIVRKEARAISKDEDANMRLQEWRRRLTGLSSALEHLPAPFKRDLTNHHAPPYKDGNVTKVYDSIQHSISTCRQEIVRRRARAMKINLKGRKIGRS